MTDDDKALVARLRDNGEFNDCAIWETMQESANRIEVQAAEIDRLRGALHKIAENYGVGDVTMEMIVARRTLADKP